MFAVAHWNDWFDFVLYINNDKMWPVQVWLRQIIVSTSSAIGNELITPNYTPPTQVVQYSVIIIATIPILIVYPFLQKYFAKGMLIGSVKG